MSYVVPAGRQVSDLLLSQGIEGLFDGIGQIRIRVRVGMVHQYADRAFDIARLRVRRLLPRPALRTTRTWPGLPAVRFSGTLSSSVEPC
jgi:hypothetical protein